MIKNTGILLVILAFLFSFTACEKEEESGSYFKLNSDETEMYYDETQCADPWYEFFNKDEFIPLKKEEKLKKYLENRNIEVLEVAYVKSARNVDIICSACKCFTGYRFYVKLKDKEEYVKKLKSMGFVRYNE